MSQPATDSIRFLRNLRAVREYTAEPIDDEAINDILEVARWSGSASNKQPTELVIVRDQDVKQKITDGGVRAAAGAALAIVIITPGNAATHDLEVFDDGRLVERIMLAAKARGLGSNIGTLKGEGPESSNRPSASPPNAALERGHPRPHRRGRLRGPHPQPQPRSQAPHRFRPLGPLQRLSCLSTRGETPNRRCAATLRGVPRGAGSGSAVSRAAAGGGLTVSRGGVWLLLWRAEPTGRRWRRR